MKYVVIFILAVFCITEYVYSYNEFKTDNSKIHKYELYHQMINDAITKAANGRNNEALLIFRKAFKLVSSPFAFDVEEALILAIESNSNEDVLDFGTILVEKGCSFSYFNKKEIVKVKKFKDEWNLLKQKINYVQFNSDEFWNIELKSKMETLYQKDQDIRKSYFDTAKYTTCWLLSEQYQNEVKLPFLKLVSENGLMGEKELGIYFPSDSTLSLSPHFPFTIILHIFQSGENRFTNEELKEFYEDGYITKLQLDYLRNFANFQNKYHYSLTNELIKNGASEDSIYTQLRIDYLNSISKN